MELVLVTTAVTVAGGVSKLGTDEAVRNPDGALDELKAAAVASENAKTAKDRALFLNLDPVLQMALVRAMRVVHGSPDVGAVSEEIEATIHYACETDQLADFRAELEGWWMDQVSKWFAVGEGPMISLIEIDARVDYLREKYKTSALSLDADDPEVSDHELEDHLFIRQMQIVKAGHGRIRNAQRNFLKASAQRSKWLRQARLDPAELNNYDRTLQDRWSAKAEIIKDELPNQADDPQKCQAGRALLGWAETQEIALRGAAAQFLTSGSYHSLADQMEVGWHPDFAKLLS